MKQAVDDIEYLRKTEFLITESMKLIINKDKIIKKAQQTLEEEFILRYIDSTKKFIDKLHIKENEMIKSLDFESKDQVLSDKIEKVKDEIKNQIKQDINEIDKKFENALSNCHNKLNAVFEESGLLIEDDEFTDGKMFFFNNETKNLVTVNVFSSEDSITLVTAPESLSIYGGFCRISEHLIFLSGGYKGSAYIDNVYIIDCKQRVAEKKMPWKIVGHTGSCSLYKNCIYNFGGTNTSDNM